jgi:hypothetical protein
MIRILLLSMLLVSFLSCKPGIDNEIPETFENLEQTRFSRFKLDSKLESEKLISPINGFAYYKGKTTDLIGTQKKPRSRTKSFKVNPMPAADHGGRCVKSSFKLQNRIAATLGEAYKAFKFKPLSRDAKNYSTVQTAEGLQAVSSIQVYPNLNSRINRELHDISSGINDEPTKHKLLGDTGKNLKQPVVDNQAKPGQSKFILTKSSEKLNPMVKPAYYQDTIQDLTEGKKRKIDTRSYGSGLFTKLNKLAEDLGDKYGSFKLSKPGDKLNSQSPNASCVQNSDTLISYSGFRASLGQQEMSQVMMSDQNSVSAEMLSGAREIISIISEKLNKTKIPHNNGLAIILSNPLSVASLMDNESMVAAFIARDPNVIKRQDQMGRTALHWAIACQASEPVIRTLAGDKTSLAIKDYEGKTPLHLAASRKLTELIVSWSLSLELFAIQDNHGNTPLHVLAKKKRLYNIELPWQEPDVWREIFDAKNHAGQSVVDLQVGEISKWLTVDDLDAWTNQNIEK